MFAEVISIGVWKDEIIKLEKTKAIKINFLTPFYSGIFLIDLHSETLISKVGFLICRDCSG